MDEQQLRLNFLAEAEDCLNQAESVLLHLSQLQTQQGDIKEQLDLALRAIHSIKGGAGMMGFATLSKASHRLEDFLKLVRLHHHSTPVSTEVESLLLACIDGLRLMVELHYQGKEIEDIWLKQTLEPIFEQLRQNLGEITPEDEQRLLAEKNQTSEALLLFCEGAEPVVDELEAKVNTLPPEEKVPALLSACEQLLFLGQMAPLQPFVELCESIQNTALLTPPHQIDSLIQEAITAWRRSLGLVLRNNIDKIPRSLGETTETTPSTVTPSTTTTESTVTGARVTEEENPLDKETLTLTLENIPLALEGEEITIEELQKLQKALEIIEQTEEKPPLEDCPIPQSLSPTTPSPNPKPQPLVRVPQEYLSQLTTLLGKMILERNQVNSFLRQLQENTKLLQKRLSHLNHCHKQLRTWYDRASTEVYKAVEEKGENVSSFDALEMDRYSDLHLFFQEGMETLVQLQEVGTDLDLSLEQLKQAVQQLNFIIGALQKKATALSMRPFGELVKGFPRLIRDLSVRFNKRVELKIEGENTLLERPLVEALQTPLNHLVRNAFAHGIEEEEVRTLSGKPPHGTISLKAFNRGTKTIITVSDDGRGISLEKIKDRLLEMGIPLQDIEQMSETQLLHQIFQPGFSTAGQVTELAGRGVGMDAVKEAIEKIGGTLTVQTEAGKGTTFTITIPFNLSVSRVLLVETAGFMYAIPITAVREILHLPSADGLSEFFWKDKTLPLVHPRHILTFSRGLTLPPEFGQPPLIDKTCIVIVGDDHHLVGVSIDRLWGEEEVSIRPIESVISPPPYVIGSFLLGDGRVLPLIEPMGMLQSVVISTPLDNYSPTPPTINKSSQKTVMVVDDSVAVRLHLTKLLEEAGYRVEQAKNGQEAVDKLLAGLPVNAVICDIEMPRLDGYGVLEEVKGKREFTSLPIIMLTSRTSEKHRKLALNLGASAYFGKPYNERELLHTLNQLVQHS
ncbi:MAG: response regulator [Geminocystis sp.]|nr:response regulator [Geminocystis sp.]